MDLLKIAKVVSTNNVENNLMKGFNQGLGTANNNQGGSFAGIFQSFKNANENLKSNVSEKISSSSTEKSTRSSQQTSPKSDDKKIDNSKKDDKPKVDAKDTKINESSPNDNVNVKDDVKTAQTVTNANSVDDTKAVVEEANEVMKSENLVKIEVPAKEFAFDYNPDDATTAEFLNAARENTNISEVIMLDNKDILESLKVEVAVPVVEASDIKIDESPLITTGEFTSFAVHMYKNSEVFKDYVDLDDNSADNLVLNLPTEDDVKNYLGVQREFALIGLNAIDEGYDSFRAFYQDNVHALDKLVQIVQNQEFVSKINLPEQMSENKPIEILSVAYEVKEILGTEQKEVAPMKLESDFMLAIREVRQSIVKVNPMTMEREMSDNEAGGFEFTSSNKESKTDNLVQNLSNASAQMPQNFFDVIKTETITVDNANINVNAVDFSQNILDIKLLATEAMLKGEEEFTMKLRPEGLGEITVKLLSSAEGKTTLSIIASNAQAAKALNDKIANLEEAMRPLRVEVRAITYDNSTNETKKDSDSRENNQNADGQRQNQERENAERDRQEQEKKQRQMHHFISYIDDEELALPFS